MNQEMQIEKKDDQINLTKMMLIESRVANEKKSALVAYLLWFFLGGFGVHNFYLGAASLGLVELFGMPLGVLLIINGQAIGFLLMGLAALLLISDLFLIPGRARAHSDRIRKKLEAELGSNAGLALPPNG